MNTVQKCFVLALVVGSQIALAQPTNPPDVPVRGERGRPGFQPAPVTPTPAPVMPGRGDGGRGGDGSRDGDRDGQWRRGGRRQRQPTAPDSSDTISTQPVLKAPQGSRDRMLISENECPTGYAMNGINITKIDRSSLVSGEQYSLNCVRVSESDASAGTDKGLADQFVSQGAPNGSYLSGISFMHESGKAQPWQESFQVFMRPILRIASGNQCRYEVSRMAQRSVSCRNTEVATAVAFSHPVGRDLTEQETVRLTCCPFTLGY